MAEETASVCNCEDLKNKILTFPIVSYCYSVTQLHKNKMTFEKPNKPEMVLQNVFILKFFLTAFKYSA